MSIETKNETKKWRLPAEWEPQSMVQLTWPHAKTDWAPMLEEITKTYNEMAEAISNREELLIVAPEPVSPSLTSNMAFCLCKNTKKSHHTISNCLFFCNFAPKL